MFKNIRNRTLIAAVLALTTAQVAYGQADVGARGAGMAGAFVACLNMCFTRRRGGMGRVRPLFFVGGLILFSQRPSSHKAAQHEHRESRQR